MYCGSVCLSIIAAAFSLGNTAPISRMLVVATVFGAVGSLFVTAALYSEHGGEGEEPKLVILCVLCSAVGTVCIVAGTQDVIATVTTGVCMVIVAGLVLRSDVRASRRGR